MRAVLQRVDRAEVAVGGETVARIGRGILALVAVARDDDAPDLEWMARKIVELRIFDDQEGKLNLSLLDVGGEILLVSQFTLYGDCRKGRRPSYGDSAPPDQARILFEQFISTVRRYVPRAATGEFQAMMDVSLVNSGPVTLILDSPRRPVAAGATSAEAE
jgi:D-aminoacyl-tRNA deacylase